MFNLRVGRKCSANLIIVFGILMASSVLAWCAVNQINNPDLYNYAILLDICLGDTCNVEPGFVLFAHMAKYIGSMTGWDPLVALYFIFIFGTLISIYSGVAVVTQKIWLAILFLALYGVTYAPVNLLVQIRFGLACGLVFFAYCYFSSHGTNWLTWGCLILAAATHFAAIPSLLILLGSNILNNNRYSSIIGSIFYISVMSLVFNLGFYKDLPDLFQDRINGYMDEWSDVSNVNIAFSLLIIIRLLYLSTLGGNLKKVLPFAFLPYVATPGVEIFIRFGVPIQYLYILNGIAIRNRENWIDHVLLLLFLSYKIISGIGYYGVLFK